MCCVYSFRALRLALQAEGYDFFSPIRPEVLAKAYANRGEDCVRHLKGMFAFAIAGLDSRHLVLARDRLGIRPPVPALSDLSVEPPELWLQTHAVGGR